MKIKGFWHVWAVNSWYVIFAHQMRVLLSSGLYDACEEISLGVIGSPSEKYFLEMYFVRQYPKLKIKYWSERAEDFEFPTLRLIVADNTEYAGFYFHTKGVSRPFETVVSHWGMFLLEAVINQWKGHYQNILNGYDASSVNYMESPNHFSGNFWWFNRAYINRCAPIESLDPTNRYHAEQWICTGNGKYIYSPFTEPGDTLFLMQRV
jgi:hypothetical protein